MLYIMSLIEGNGQKPTYLEESDFEIFLNLLGDVCERYHWVIHSFYFMINHYHLLVETPIGKV